MGGGGELRKVNMLWHKYERIIDATFILVYTNFYSNSIKYSKKARSCLNNQKAICMP